MLVSECLGSSFLLGLIIIIGVGRIARVSRKPELLWHGLPAENKSIAPTNIFHHVCFPAMQYDSTGPLQKFSNPKEYNRVVENLMFTQGIDRKQAEKEYDAYLNNPNDYALNKGEAYYKSLGYKSLMDGVIGEAEKEGRGEEVRARIEKFNRESKTKGLITITSFIALGFYFKMTHPYVPPLH